MSTRTRNIKDAWIQKIEANSCGVRIVLRRPNDLETIVIHMDWSNWRFSIDRWTEIAEKRLVMLQREQDEIRNSFKITGDAP